jgi:hypothetical protein
MLINLVRQIPFCHKEKNKKQTNHDQINLIPVDFILQLLLFPQLGYSFGIIYFSFPVFGLKIYQ